MKEQQTKLDRVLQFIEAHPELFESQGSVVASYRKYRETRMGPYWNLMFRVAGQQKKLYLGANDEIAEKVKQRLSEVQAPVRERRVVRRARSCARRALARRKRELERHLAKLEIYMHGWEPRRRRPIS